VDGAPLKCIWELTRTRRTSKTSGYVGKLFKSRQ